MTLDGFLTFLGLAAAVFAIIPPVARLRIRLQLGVQIALAAIAVTLALYFEFFEFVALPCPSILGGVCPLLQMQPIVNLRQKWLHSSSFLFGWCSHFLPRRSSLLAKGRLDRWRSCLNGFSTKIAMEKRLIFSFLIWNLSTAHKTGACGPNALTTGSPGTGLWMLKRYWQSVRRRIDCENHAAFCARWQSCSRVEIMRKKIPSAY